MAIPRHSGDQGRPSTIGRDHCDGEGRGAPSTPTWWRRDFLADAQREGAWRSGRL